MKEWRKEDLIWTTLNYLKTNSGEEGAVRKKGTWGRRWGKKWIMLPSLGIIKMEGGGGGTPNSHINDEEKIIWLGTPVNLFHLIVQSHQQLCWPLIYSINTIKWKYPGVIQFNLGYSILKQNFKTTKFMGMWLINTIPVQNFHHMWQFN